MSNRSLLFLLLLLLGVFLAVKFDLPTKVTIAVTNQIYGDEMRGIGGFRILAEVPNPEVAREGLTGESVRKALAAALAKAGVKSLPDDLWQKTPGKPSLSVSVQAVKQAGGIYQYTVTIEVVRSEAEGAAPGAEKNKTIWSTNKIGEGNVSDIRKNIDEITGVFLKARSGG
ncbi:MAG: hypothetical protein NT047_08675 [Deltaproteobacteria bacterium]|nr:hypothetical protein [Deltaproteobacteria bacterium]